MSSPRSAGRHASPLHAVGGRRDAAMERSRSITKTIAVTSAAAVAAFGIYISRALPGHAATSSGPSGSTVGPSGGSVSTGGSSASQSSGNLAPPESPPQPSPHRAPWSADRADGGHGNGRRHHRAGPLPHHPLVHLGRTDGDRPAGRGPSHDHPPASAGPGRAGGQPVPTRFGDRPAARRGGRGAQLDPSRLR